MQSGGPPVSLPGQTPLATTTSSGLAEEEKVLGSAGGNNMEGVDENSRRQQLFSLAAAVKQGRRPEARAFATALAGGGIAPSDPEGWSAMCGLLRALVRHFPGEPAMWSEVMVRMIARINALDVNITPALFAAVQKALKLFHKLMRGTQTLRLEKASHTSRGALSLYDMMTELRHFVIEQERGGSAHWTLETFQNILRIRKHNLSSMMTVTGSAERCRLVGSYQVEEASVFHRVSSKHRVVDEKTLSSPRTAFVYSLLQMIIHRAPMDLIKAQIAPGESGSGPLAAAAAAVAAASSPSGPLPSSQLTEAVVFRVCQLLELEQPRGDLSAYNVEQFCDMWWGQWQTFSEALYSFVEDGMIDFGQFIVSLGRSQRQSTPGKIKDNIVLWLIAQCLPLENVKKLFVHDLTNSHGRLFLRMFEFYNAQQSESSNFELRDVALHCLIFRLYNARDSTSRTDLKTFIPTQLQPLYERGTKAVLNYRQWWNETEKNGENLDFYNIPWTKLWHVCLLSNFTSSPISNAFFEAMNKPLEPIQQCVLPGNLPFRGRTPPIPTIYLFLLSTRTRQRLLDLLEAHILRSRQPNEPHNNPAIVSTYARLLYAAPYSRNRFRLLKNLGSSEPTVLHVLIELLNFRLLRFFKYHSSVRHVYLHLHEVAMTTAHHILFHSLENLLLKLSLNLEEVIKFSKATTVINFGQSLNRALVLGIAKQIKCRGVSNFVHLRQLPQLLARLTSVTRHNWSLATLKYFPNVMKDHFEQSQRVDPEAAVTKELVYAEFQTQETLLRGALGEETPYAMNYVDRSDPDACTHRLNEYYLNNRDVRKLFFCLVWIVLRERDTTHAINILRVLQQFSPQEATACHFALIDFVLDTLQPQQLMFLPEPASPELIGQTGGLLSRMIWQYSIARFEVILQALMDRDDDMNSFSLIDYLLNQNTEFSSRADFWCSLGVRSDHWRDQTYFTNHRQYHDKFPELLAMPGTVALPSYYGNVCLRALPVLDVLIGRLLEHDHLQLLERVLGRYWPLWKYHESPITFTYELLHYYHSSDSISANMWKLNLLTLLREAAPRFSAAFKEFSATKNPDVVSSDAYFRSVIDLVANHLATELPSDSNFHTTATLQIFEEFSNVCRETITTTLLELLLLPFSASDVANKLLDIALGAMPSPPATSVVGTQPTTQGHMTAAAAPAPSVLDSLMQVEYSAASSSLGSPSSMLDLLDMDTAAPSISEPILTTDAFPATAPAATLYTATIAPGGPPTFSQLSAVAILLSFLPDHFHTPIYERALLLLKHHPLLASISFCEEMLPPGAGPFSCYSFTDYSSNISSTLDNLPNRVLCLLHNFFLYGSVENLAIYPNFIRALAPSSVQQLFIACKLIAPFFYRINSKPELCGEILLELYRAMAVVSSAQRMPASSLADSVNNNYLDTVIDFLNHASSLYEGTDATLASAVQQIVSTLPRQLQSALQSPLTRGSTPRAV